MNVSPLSKTGPETFSAPKEHDYLDKPTTCRAAGTHPPTKLMEYFDINTFFLINLPVFYLTVWATVNTNPGFVG